MLVILLSILDILAGIFIVWQPDHVYFKGIFFLGSGVFAGTFEWMSAIDIVVGIMLIFRLEVGWFAIVPIIKGIYCIVLSFVAR